MKSAYSTARRGLTLLELVVVLAILAALAGLLLPLAGQYLEKAHASSSADNIKEITKAVQQYNAVTRNYPDSLDSLLEDATANTLEAQLPGTETSYLSVTPIDDYRTSLSAVGITTVMSHDAAVGASATFDGTSSSAGIPAGVDAAANIATLVDGADVVAAQFGYVGAASPVYAVFGFGHNTEIIGEWIQEAPFHFPDAGNPNDTYSRYALVFEVFADGSPAKFVGCAAIHPDGLEGQLGHLEEFFE